MCDCWGGQVLTIFAAIYSQNNETPFFSYVSPGVIAFSIIWFYLFASCELHCPDWLARIIRTLSDCTFGIYLVHMWILIQVFFRVHRFIEQPILLTIVCVGMAFVGGFIIMYLLKKFLISINIYAKYSSFTNLFQSCRPCQPGLGKACGSEAEGLICLS